MKNFGLSNLHLVNPIATLGPNGRMRGGHAQDILDSIVEHRSLVDPLEGLDLCIGTTAQRGYDASNLIRKPMTPQELVVKIQSFAGSVGIVFGREGTGLTNSELDQCDATLTIPASSEYQTLNLSHAAAIVFYELSLSSRESSADGLATDPIKKAILRFLSESAALSGMDGNDRGLLTRAFRNILGRSAIRYREGNLLAEAMRRISETLSLAINLKDSESPQLVSESDSGSRHWDQQTPGPSQRHPS